MRNKTQRGPADDGPMFSNLHAGQPLIRENYTMVWISDDLVRVDEETVLLIFRNQKGFMVRLYSVPDPKGEKRTIKKSLW